MAFYLAVGVFVFGLFVLPLLAMIVELVCRSASAMDSAATRS